MQDGTLRSAEVRANAVLASSDCRRTHAAPHAGFLPNAGVDAGGRRASAVLGRPGGLQDGRRRCGVVWTAPLEAPRCRPAVRSVTLFWRPRTLSRPTPPGEGVPFPSQSRASAPSRRPEVACPRNRGKTSRRTSWTREYRACLALWCGAKAEVNRSPRPTASRKRQMRFAPPKGVAFLRVNCSGRTRDRLPPPPLSATVRWSTPQDRLRMYFAECPDVPTLAATVHSFQAILAKIRIIEAGTQAPGDGDDGLGQRDHRGRR